MIKPLPFQLRREAAEALSAQIADGVRRAITDGYYQAGERLPNLDEMATDLQVARETVRQAVGRLARHGTVVARRKAGIVVADSGSQTYLHHLLHASRGGTSYYFSTRNAHLAQTLADLRVRYTAVELPAAEITAGLPHVRAVLEGNAVGLVLVDGPADGVRELCQQHEVPFLMANQERDAQAVAQVVTDFAADVALANHAQRQGIRRVGLVGFQSHRPSLVAAFRAAHIEIESVLAVRVSGEPAPQTVEAAGYECVRARLASGVPLPDLLYFVDDYLGRGGLTALLAAGVRVPQDLRVATHANRGHLPAFPVSLTRIEVDPVADGEIMAQTAVKLLRSERRLAAPVVTTPQLIIGDSL